MKLLSAKMNKERRFNKHFASCLIINKNGKTELIAPKQMDNSLCQQSEMDSVEESLTTTKNEGNQSFSHILEEIRIANQTISELEQIKHIDEDADKLGLTLFEMEQKPHVVNYHEIQLTMISETLDLNDNCLKAETFFQIGEKYLTSQSIEDSNSEERLGYHDQESQDQESKDQESQAQESQSQVQESHVQESHIQESHDQEIHDQDIKLPMTSETLDLNDKCLKAETIPQIGEKYLASQTMEEGRLGSHDQESQDQESHVQESHVQESHVQESHVQESHVQESYVQESQDQESQIQESHNYKSHDQESHNQESHVQENHVQESHIQESHNYKSHDQESHNQESHVQENHVQESHVQESHIQESHDHKSQAQAQIKVNDINKETKSNTILKGHKYKTDSKENEGKEDSKVQKKEMLTKKGLRVMDTNSNNCNFNIKNLSLNNSNSTVGFPMKNENNKKMMMNTNSNDCNLNKKESSMKKSNSTFAFQMKNENNKVIDRVSDLRKIRRTSKFYK
jgi:hypothetical protein